MNTTFDGPAKVGGLGLWFFGWQLLRCFDETRGATSSTTVRSVGAFGANDDGYWKSAGQASFASLCWSIADPELADGFCDDRGHPSKDLSVAAGALILQQLHDLTDQQTTEAVAADSLALRLGHPARAGCVSV
ncbi:MAG: hypothetical protein R3B91_09145 [Planctomycetaceae bacterium]